MIYNNTIISARSQIGNRLNVVDVQLKWSNKMVYSFSHDLQHDGSIYEKAKNTVDLYLWGRQIPKMPETDEPYYNVYDTLIDGDHNILIVTNVEKSSGGYEYVYDTAYLDDYLTNTDYKSFTRSGTGLIKYEGSNIKATLDDLSKHRVDYNSTYSWFQRKE
jgi:hypothetical protein